MELREREIGRLAYLAYINVVNPGWYSRNRHVEQKAKPSRLNRGFVDPKPEKQCREM